MVTKYYLVMIIIDSIVTCLFGSLYSMTERQRQEKLHHLRLKQNILDGHDLMVNNFHQNVLYTSAYWGARDIHYQCTDVFRIVQISISVYHGLKS